jgi:hypothetical protein
VRHGLLITWARPTAVMKFGKRLPCININSPNEIRTFDLSALVAWGCKHSERVSAGSHQLHAHKQFELELPLALVKFCWEMWNARLLWAIAAFRTWLQLLVGPICEFWVNVPCLMWNYASSLSYKVFQHCKIFVSYFPLLQSKFSVLFQFTICFSNDESYRQLVERPGSSVGIAVGMSWTVGVRFQACAKIILYSTEFRPLLGPTYPHIQWVTRALSPALSSQGMKLTTHLLLVPRLRKLEMYLHSTICLHGIVFNWLSTRTIVCLFPDN